MDTKLTIRSVVEIGMGAEVEVSNFAIATYAQALKSLHKLHADHQGILDKDVNNTFNQILEKMIENGALAKTHSETTSIMLEVMRHINPSEEEERERELKS